MSSNAKNNAPLHEPVDQIAGDRSHSKFGALIRRLPPFYRPGVLIHLDRATSAHAGAAPAPHPHRVFFQIEPDGTFEARF
jgi:hypothetical protein